MSLVCSVQFESFKEFLHHTFSIPKDGARLKRSPWALESSEMCSWTPGPEFFTESNWCQLQSNIFKDPAFACQVAVGSESAPSPGNLKPKDTDWHILTELLWNIWKNEGLVTATLEWGQERLRHGIHQWQRHQAWLVEICYGNTRSPSLYPPLQASLPHPVVGDGKFLGAQETWWILSCMAQRNETNSWNIMQW